MRYIGDTLACVACVCISFTGPPFDKLWGAIDKLPVSFLELDFRCAFWILRNSRCHIHHAWPDQSGIFASSTLIEYLNTHSLSLSISQFLIQKKNSLNCWCLLSVWQKPMLLFNGQITYRTALSTIFFSNKKNDQADVLSNL